MEAQEALRGYLNDTLGAKKDINPRYSLRSFAKDLEIHPSALSLIMNGKRNVSQDLAAKLLHKSHAAPSMLTNILELFDKKSMFDKLKKYNKSRNESVHLEQDQYDIVADWTHYAILSLFETKDFIFDYEWISRRLGITIQKTVKSVEALQRNGYIVYENGGYVVKNISLKTTNDIANKSLNERHQANLEDAKEALYTVDLLEREFCFTTMAINKSKIREAKEMIREFKARFTEFMEEDNQDEVYEFQLQFYPRSKRSSRYQ